MPNQRSKTSSASRKPPSAPSRKSAPTPNASRKQGHRAPSAPRPPPTPSHQPVGNRPSRPKDHALDKIALASKDKGVENPLRSLQSGRSSHREITATITDYFDIEKIEGQTGAFQYSFGTISEFLTPAPAEGSSKSNFMRVTSAKFYALPRFTNSSGTIDSSTSTIIIGFSTPAQLQDTVQPANNAPTCVNQQTTLLKPTSVYKWSHVGTFKESSFRNTLLRPTFVEDFGAMILGTLGVLSPDTGEFVSTLPIQCRVDISVAITVPTVVAFNGAVNPQLADSSLDPWSNRIPLTPETPLTQNGFLRVRGSRDKN